MSGPQSPSLRKMEASGPRRDMRPRTRFSMGRVIGDPFALATISMALLAWLIAFVSGIVTAIQVPRGFPNYAWWGIAYYLCCILGIMCMVANDSVYTYHVAAVGFLSQGLFLTVSAVNNLVYSSNGAAEASAAGFILLSIISIVWIFYFGSQSQATHRNFIDSFALHRGNDGPLRHSPRPMSNMHFGQSNNSTTNTAPQTYNKNNLMGFEAASPITNYTQPNGLDSRGSPTPQKYGGPASPQNYTANPSSSNLRPTSQVPDGDATSSTEYPYRARAIYSYEANPDDANEISFQKHEILEVSDVSGRWWQAKKASGVTGIAPSNYLILL